MTSSSLGSPLFSFSCPDTQLILYVKKLIKLPGQMFALIKEV
jgi:hypothetical protein